MSTYLASESKGPPRALSAADGGGAGLAAAGGGMEGGALNAGVTLSICVTFGRTQQKAFTNGG